MGGLCILRWIRAGLMAHVPSPGSAGRWPARSCSWGRYVVAGQQPALPIRRPPHAAPASTSAPAPSPASVPPAIRAMRARRHRSHALRHSAAPPAVMALPPPARRRWKSAALDARHDRLKRTVPARQSGPAPATSDTDHAEVRAEMRHQIIQCVDADLGTEPGLQFVVQAVDFMFCGGIHHQFPGRGRKSCFGRRNSSIGSRVSAAARPAPRRWRGPAAIAWPVPAAARARRCPGRS